MRPAEADRISDALLVKREVAVKVLVTDGFKSRLIEQLRETLSKVDMTLSQLESRGKRYLSEIQDRDPEQAEAYRLKLEGQKRRQETVRAGLAERLARAERLEPGDEYPQGKIETLAEIRVGDNLSEKLREAEILIEEGIIKEIRNS